MTEKGFMIIRDGISVLDYSSMTNKICKCGKDVQFKLSIFGTDHELCEKCLAKIAHCIIDGLE